MTAPLAVQVVVYPQTTSPAWPSFQQPSAAPVYSPHTTSSPSPNAAESIRCFFEDAQDTRQPPPMSPRHASMAPPPSVAPFLSPLLVYAHLPAGAPMPPPTMKIPTPMHPGGALPLADWTQVPAWTYQPAPPHMPPSQMPPPQMLPPHMPQLNLLLSAETGPAPPILFDLSAHAYEPRKHAAGWFPSMHLAQDELSQPATYPAVARMIFVCAEVSGWRVVLESPSNAGFLSVHAVLSAVHRMLHRQITHTDWHKLSDERAEEIARAYTRRTRALAATAAYEESKLQGVKWVDYLEEEYMFGGLVGERGEQGAEQFRLVVRKD
ncbi:hypothetical protein PsYK624_169060 [Phanerochaete sordida]|uniref:DUF6699 domain-containing protein n=1 Tax=Phanerochaete sordida TaxID=48140 RepID=A0A9P3GST2_9APHY|nr:hypothetical protein PsYK624_169060 [Phanerochaete sordida]